MLPSIGMTRKVKKKERKIQSTAILVPKCFADVRGKFLSDGFEITEKQL